MEIPVDGIVLDDVILLSSGQQVPADCIMLEGSAELNEALLTGESVPIKKEYGDELFAGSFVAGGHLAARVYKIGEGVPLVVEAYFPANYGDEELNGVKAYFEVFIRDVNDYDVAELNDNFITGI